MQRKACLNPSCGLFRKKYFNAKEQFCPQCSAYLQFVCTAKGCYKQLPADQRSHLCAYHKAERHDKVEIAWDNTKKIGGAVLGVAGLALVAGEKIAKKFKH